MLNLLKVDRNPDPKDVEKFIKSRVRSEYFRYFDSRPFDIVSSHEICVMLYSGKNPVAYGHLEKEDGDTWLGICVDTYSRGKGFGTMMMTVLMSHAPEVVRLSVDKANTGAINLYKKFCFEITAEEDGIVYMEYGNG